MDVGFAVLLSGAPFNQARRLQLELSRIIGNDAGLRTSPHITVKSPFTVDAFEPVAAYLDEVASRTPAFDVQLEGFGVFSPSVIYIGVLDSPELVTLHHRILNDLWQRFGVEPGPFEGPNVKFHVTVAITDGSENAMSSAMEWLAGRNLRLRFRVETLGLLMSLDQPAGWATCHISTLGASGTPVGAG